ncbi:MAG: ABC transporter substrate-binding protein [Propionicimonas sp.]|nr:ABC transporter substrate-binding protein [Propionicimonas sp.]
MRVDRRWLAAALAAVLLAGCTPEQPTIPSETATPSPSPTPRDFTVSTTGPIRTTDPALALGDTDVLIGTNVFQRLMQVQPGTGELKPDAATDCIFSSETVYECTLPAGLVFHNGDELTSSDVRFSIQRALRLDGGGTAVSLLDSLVRITTPDPLTIRFHLGYADNRFGYALASLAASIVDEETFNPDTGLSLEEAPIGSGPYQVESIDPEEVVFTRFVDYAGPLVGVLERIRLEHLPDSVAAETAILDGTTDLVWRSLDPPAVERLETEITASADQATAQGFTRWALDGTRVTRLAWTPESTRRTDATLRAGVALALQPDRTLASLVPIGVEGYLASFPIGGRPELPEIKGKRITLTLRYDPSAPGHADVASLLRARIEELDRVSVRLVTEGGADLALTDFPAWVPIASGWLQSYLDDPLPGSADKLAELDQRARSTSGDAKLVALGELQKQAAADATVLPVSQSDGVMMVGRGVSLAGLPFGSSGQLGLWGLRHG